MDYAVLAVAAVFVVLIALLAVKTVRIIPQARARNIERLGRYRKTLEPGMNVIIPFIDRVKPLIDLREQVVSFLGQPVITEDNLVVSIDTVLFFQVTDPRAADYEIVDYILAIEQITATMLRSVIGSMDLEQTLTSRDKINALLRGVLDDASGKWGIRVTRVELKAIDPPKSVKDAMEKQMRAEREKRAAVLTAEGVRQSKILTAEGEKQSAILTAEGLRQAKILTAQGEAQAITEVFQAVHDNDPDPKLLAYQYLQTLPLLAQGAGNTFWVIPSEVTSALRSVASAFGGGADSAPESPRPRRPPPAVPAGSSPAIDAAAAGTAPEITAGTNGTGSGPASPSAASPATASPATASPATASPATASPAGPNAIPGVSSAVSAMLADAIPGANFVDPLGFVDPEVLADPEADVPAVTQDANPPTVNGTESGD